METNSSGEELVVKTRKPYTITKQREKWTEEEHNKFIDALKLYGRAWQRIEEHIGTKTAVQIRSHAQKFFTKLEKEAITKGVPPGQAHDIEIPPPRPKRKPSSPYPRKTGGGSLFSSGEATEEKSLKSPPLISCKQAGDVANSAALKIQGAKDNSEEGNCSEVLNLFRDAPVVSISSLSKGSSNLCAYNGFMPLEKGMKGKSMLKGSSMSTEVNESRKENDSVKANRSNGELKGPYASIEMKSAQEEGADISKQPDNMDSVIDNLQRERTYTNHVPLDFMKRSGSGNVPTTIAGQGSTNVNAKTSLKPTIPSTSEINTNSGTSVSHSFPAFPPFIHFPNNPGAYCPAHSISSPFSSHILSTLLQNPAVHAAACVAASFWPIAGLDASMDSSSETGHGGLPERHMNPSPSMAAIAAATVAAASAWWATQGLLPMYPPIHPGFTFAPPTRSIIPTVDPARAPDGRIDEKVGTFGNTVGGDQQDMNPEQSEATRAQHPSPKSLSSSSSDSEESRSELDGAQANKFKSLSSNDIHDNDKVRNKKADRSSCGSNTSSSSEVEGEAVLKNQDGDKDEPKQAFNPPSGETNNRRIRSGGNMNESWKEVSEEGRLAFQALFNRDVLPQSFSQAYADSRIMTANKEAISELPVDLNVKASNEPTDFYYFRGSGNTSVEAPLTNEIIHGWLKARRTGFKPYKRCSMEAKESRATADDETGNKRIRLEGDTSI